ncbi:hypothetical protein D3C77_754900 [compost metagenome]
MNDSASLPIAEDQKLTEGRSTMSVAKRRMYRDFWAVALRRLASKAISPRKPNML